MTDDAYTEAIYRLYPGIHEAIHGYRKDVAASALAVVLAEICLLGVNEDEAKRDCGLVAAAIMENIGKLAFARADTVGMMN